LLNARAVTPHATLHRAWSAWLTSDASVAHMQHDDRHFRLPGTLAHLPMSREVRVWLETRRVILAEYEQNEASLMALSTRQERGVSSSESA